MSSSTRGVLLGGWSHVAVGSSLQVAVVVIVAALVARALLRRHAAARHGLWLGALVWVLLSPAVSVVADRAGLTLCSVVRRSAPTETAKGGRPAEPVSVPRGQESILADVLEREPLDREPSRLGGEASPVAAPDASLSSPRASSRAIPLPSPPGPVRKPEAGGFEEADPARRTESVEVWFAGVWAAGVLAGFARILFGWSRLRRVVRGAHPLDVGRHAEVLTQVREALAVTALSPVDTSSEVAGPVVIGTFRPRVVLPVGLAESLDGPSLRDVLVHECAHAVRRDPRVGLLQRVAAVLFWPHPLVHVLNAQLTRAREEVCDNHVLRCEDACGYARTLLTLTVLCRPRGAARAEIGLLTPRWTLADRVSGLLDPGRIAMTRMTVRSRIAIAVALAATGFAVSGIRLEGPALAGTPDEPEGKPAAARVGPDQAGRSIKGIVVDEQGTPVAGAIVRPVHLEKAPQGATTAVDGTFTLTLRGLLLLKEHLIAEADAGARMGLAAFVEPPDSRTPDPVRLVLKPSRRLTVRVKDLAGGVVAGATVEALDFDWHARGITAADGSLTLGIPADVQLRWVFALKAGVGFDYYETDRSRTSRTLPPPPADVTLTLDGARVVRIRAIDSGGKPVPGVSIDPWVIGKPGKIDGVNVGGRSTVSALTDADGVAVFDWLPVLAEHEVSFLVPPGPYSCPRPLVYKPGGPADVTARLLRNTRISGALRYPDGRPAAGVLIQAAGQGASINRSRFFTRSQADGSYSFEVYPEQSYILAVVDESWASRSHTGLAVREGKPDEGLDFSLSKGTLVRGRVTVGAGHEPAAGLPVTLSQKGGPLPAEFQGPYVTGGPSLDRRTTTDEAGRYHFRVGPGTFELRGPDYRIREIVKVDGSRDTDIVHDFSTEKPAPRKRLSGRVIERAPAGERLVARAMVEMARTPQGGWFKAQADENGRFSAERGPGSMVLYARDPEGKRAGFTEVPADVADVTLYITTASRVSGRVVDAGGRPVVGRRVQVRLDVGRDDAASGRIFRQLTTDNTGRYTYEGVVVGKGGEISVRPSEDDDASPQVQVARFEVPGFDPIELADFVLPIEVSRRKTPRAAAEPAAGGSRPSVPAGPSRAEIEGLIRAVGRDPVTEDLVDRIALDFRPQVLWARDFARTRQLATDPEFVGRVDAAARDAGDQRARTLTLVRVAEGYHVGSDDAILALHVRRSVAAAGRPLVALDGKVIDVQTGRPISGARVYTNSAIARTDVEGRFTLRASPQSRSSQPVPLEYWVEAEGYALREVAALVGGSGGQSVALVREVPLEGQVLAPGGRPLARADVMATVDRAAVARRSQDDLAGGGNAVTFQVRTDAEGSFSFRGIPPTERPVSLRINHPEYEQVSVQSAVPTNAADPLIIRLRSGCAVSGMVVDELGRPVPGARVEIRKPSGNHDEFSTHTDGLGQFRFSNVSSGRWDLVVEPERHALVALPIVAHVKRPVETQVVVTNGAYISGKVLDADGTPLADAAVGWVEPLGALPPPNRITNTAADGTFRLGPLPQGEFRITGLAESPRRLGKVVVRANQTDAVIRLKPAPIQVGGR